MEGLQIDDSANNTATRRNLVNQIFRNPFSRSSRHRNSDSSSSSGVSSRFPSTSNNVQASSALVNSENGITGNATASLLNTTTATVQVSVLIAMPSPQNSVHNHLHISRAGNTNPNTNRNIGGSSGTSSSSESSSNTRTEANITKGKARSLSGGRSPTSSGVIELAGERARRGGLLGTSGDIRVAEEVEEDQEEDREVPDVAIGIAQLPLRRATFFASSNHDYTEADHYHHRLDKEM